MPRSRLYLASIRTLPLGGATSSCFSWVDGTVRCDREGLAEATACDLCRGCCPSSMCGSSSSRDAWRNHITPAVHRNDSNTAGMFKVSKRRDPSVHGGAHLFRHVRSVARRCSLFFGLSFITETTGGSGADFWLKVNLRGYFLFRFASLLQDFPFLDFERRRHSSKFFELSFYLAELLMQA